MCAVDRLIEVKAQGRQYVPLGCQKQSSGTEKYKMKNKLAILCILEAMHLILLTNSNPVVVQLCEPLFNALHALLEEEKT